MDAWQKKLFGLVFCRADVKFQMDIEEQREKIVGFLDSGKYKMAELWIKKILAENSKDVNFHYLLAEVLYRQKAFFRANEELNFIRMHLYNQFNQEGGFLIEQLQGLCLRECGESEKASECFKRSSMFAKNLQDKTRMYSSYLFMSNYFENLSEEELSNRHKAYGDFFEGVQQYEHVRRNKKKIRIGYISPDFREHVVVYFMYALLSKYDKNRFEVFCYAKCREDPISEQLKSLVDSWTNIEKMIDDDVAGLLYRDEIDILVELAGHSADNSLFALAKKPAPIQICGIGYFNTTGLPAVDYFLTDAYCDPVGKNDELFTEKLLRLPHSHFCYTPPDTALAYDCNKSIRENVVFGSFNNFSKITDEVLLTWLRILKKVPSSKLLLKNPRRDKKKEVEDIRGRALAVGFCEEQLDLRDASLPYLNEYADMDIALDTFPYPGGGTTCEALFMGCPLVTLAGRRHGARFGYSILRNIGLEELAADSVESYIEIAVALAGDRDLLSYLQKNLRSIMQKSYLMNGEIYVREVEAAYEKIWQDWLENK